MKTEFTLHKLSEGFIITSDEETLSQNGDKYLGHPNYDKVFTWDMKGIHEGKSVWIKKIIAQQDQIDFSALLEEEQKEIDWFNFEKLAKTEIEGWQRDDVIMQVGFTLGFQKAQELLFDRRFTEKQVIKFTMSMLSQYVQGNTNIWNRELLKESLSQPKSWKIELELEDSFKENNEKYINDFGIKGNYSTHSKIPKFINNKIKILRIL